MSEQINPPPAAAAGSDGGSTGGGHRGSVPAADQPVRSRWTPKPEQILTLESIFNSGMVNPSKGETARIRRLLEKFGPVGDANVFYWFQNRRSRSRRRQRQMQAGQQPAGGDRPRAAAAGVVQAGGAGTVFPHEVSPPSAACSFAGGGSSSGGGPVVAASEICSSSFIFLDDGAGDLFSISRQMGFPGVMDQTPIISPPGVSSFHDFHSDMVMVFINGIAQEVPRGPIDMSAVFGHDVMLVHSSGEVVPMNEYGLLFPGLHAGESYFLNYLGTHAPLPGERTRPQQRRNHLPQRVDEALPYVPAGSGGASEAGDI